MKAAKPKLKAAASPAPGGDLLSTLQARFEQDMDRHKGLRLGKSKGARGSHPARS